MEKVGAVVVVDGRRAVMLPLVSVAAVRAECRGLCSGLESLVVTCVWW